MDGIRVALADKAALAQTKEARILYRSKQKEVLDIAEETGKLLYGAGIDDSV